jgi:Zn finger protein HypA/HybF involved in hydrogenase expression
VCSGCVRGWNLALLDGGDGVTSAKTAPKLKCPDCTTPLRRMDAAEVLRRLPDVSQKWDLLTRDALLRSMPDFRSCPKCPGGGFTTPECLAPRHEAIVVVANELVAQYRAAVLSLYAGTALLVAREGSPTYIAALAVTVVVGARVLAQWAARAATAIVSAPLMVECPECTDEYLLQGYGETLSGERQTDDWIHQHTRPCPACGSPIQKSGGCNAMVCGACSSPFCWACMRAKSVCNHFECANGSPFADKQTTGGRNGQPLAVNTPAAHTAALVDLTNFLGMIYMTVACGALSASLAGEPTFSSPQWLVERSGQLAVLGLRGLLYLAVVAGGGVLLMIVYRAYDRHRGSRRWGR